MLILPVALAATGAAAIINIWLGIRIGRVRVAEKISIGDGGNERLIARMRAQLNFAEYTPIVLILIALIEFGAGTQLWLWATAALYLLGRLLHPIGMDVWMPARTAGIATTMLVMLGLVFRDYPGAAAFALENCVGRRWCREFDEVVKGDIPVRAVKEKFVLTRDADQRAEQQFLRGHPGKEEAYFGGVVQLDFYKVLFACL